MKTVTIYTDGGYCFANPGDVPTRSPLARQPLGDDSKGPVSEERLMKVVTIYTDGACSGNPGPGGWGAILRYGPHEKEDQRRGAEHHQQPDGAHRGDPRPGRC